MLETIDLFCTAGKKNLIENINVQFLPGQIHGVLGPNGSGKTTLLKCLSGILKPTEGRILWKKEDLLKKSRREQSGVITLVPQNLHIPFDFTVEQFVSMGLYPHGVKLEKTQSAKRINESLEAVDASAYSSYNINNLSQGERQRVLIARALATGAEILVLDEPMANIDLKHKRRIWNLLKTLSEQKKTIIISNHDLENCQRYCDQVFVLKTGACVSSGNFDEAVTPVVLQDVFEVTSWHS